MTADDGDEPVVRRDALRDDQALQDGEGEGVDVLECPQHGQAHAGPCGQDTEVRWNGRGEVRPGLQQPRQPIVRPAAQLVGEAARRTLDRGGGHPIKASRGRKGAGPGQRDEVGEG